MAQQSDDDDREYLIEYQVHGNSVKVSAVDSLTLTEVSIVGPASAGEEVLKRNAINKLRRALDRQADKQPETSQKKSGRYV